MEKTNPLIWFSKMRSYSYNYQIGVDTLVYNREGNGLGLNLVTFILDKEDERWSVSPQRYK